MITDRSQYRYVGGDLSQVVVNGGIMPLRPAADKKLLRGEDVAFLLEGCLERLGWWTSFTNSYGGSVRYPTNPNAIGAWGTSLAPFSRNVKLENDYTVSSIAHCTGVGAVGPLTTKVYTPGQFTSDYRTYHFGFLSALPETSYSSAVRSDFVDELDRQGVLLGVDDMTFDGFSDAGVILQDKVAKLFADLKRAKYAFISVPIEAPPLTETASEKDSEVGWPESVGDNTSGDQWGWSDSRTVWDGPRVAHLMANNTLIAGIPAFSLHISQFNQSTSRVDMFKFPSGASLRDNAVRTFCLVSMNYQWGRAPNFVQLNGRNYTYMNCAERGAGTFRFFADRTNEENGHRNDTWSFYNPTITESFMRTSIARLTYLARLPIYDSSISTESRFSQYAFNVKEVVIIAPMSDRTQY